MAGKLILNTADESLRNVLSNGKKYVVPKFQRDYSWEHEQWRDFWEDLETIAQGDDEFHYMGYLVFQEFNKMTYKVIDGQQRLTTFSLLVLAAIARLKEMGGEQERINTLVDSFIGTKDLTYLRVENKLKLNRNNDFNYRQAVDGKLIHWKGKKETIKLMATALDYFHDQFKHLTNGEEIGKFIEQSVDGMLFTIIYIGDDLNAYTVFETLNARGVKLSSADLLKNYLFSMMDAGNETPDDVVDEWDQKWGEIGENLGTKSYADYVLTEWNSRHKQVRHTMLFKVIKKEVDSAEKARKYLDRLQQNSPLYPALLNDNDEFWKDHSKFKRIKGDLTLLRLFSIRQPVSLLMAAHIKFESKFHKILDWVTIFSLRYNVICRGHPNKQEVVYSEICENISAGCSIGAVKTALLTLYPSDDEFERAFTDKTLLNRKARYLLARLAEHYGNSAIDETKLTVEHILPLNPEQNWINDFGGGWQQSIQRLGNMALVTQGENNELGQEPFAKKQCILMKSKYALNKTVEPYSEWTIEEVESRQKELAQKAVSLWRIER